MPATIAGCARLYDELAWLWPVISPVECYEEESACLGVLLARYARRPVRTLLDLGCASGHHECALRRDFAITGVDCAPAMLVQARAANPAGTYREGDLRTVRLGTQFDAVLLLDAVNYMTTEADLAAALDTARAHLAPGGVLITVAEHTAETFEETDPRASVFEHDGTQVTVLERYAAGPAEASHFLGVFVYTIERDGTRRVERDEHRFGLFPLGQWRGLLADRFDAVHEPDFEETAMTGTVFVCTMDDPGRSSP